MTCELQNTHNIFLLAKQPINLPDISKMLSSNAIHLPDDAHEIKIGVCETPTLQHFGKDKTKIIFHKYSIENYFTNRYNEFIQLALCTSIHTFCSPDINNITTAITGKNDYVLILDENDIANLCNTTNYDEFLFEPIPLDTFLRHIYDANIETELYYIINQLSYT